MCSASPNRSLATVPPPLPPTPSPSPSPTPPSPTARRLLQRLPERILEKCVKGMLPKGRIASPLFHHLKVYKGTAHPHEAQRPTDITSLISAKPSVAAAATAAATY